MKTFIVAEMSGNHGGKLENAIKTVHAVKETGADAIKLQTYTADTITLNCDAGDFVVKGTTFWNNERLYNLYCQAYTPWEWHEAIYNEAQKIGLVCFSTPFDETAVDLLESLGNPIYKVASPEITDVNLIRLMASKGKPMVISTGTALVEDIEEAIRVCHEEGNHDITILKCTTEYPAPIEAANLRTMVDMGKRFGVKFGLSDHTMGSDVPVAAVALGASMIEKHFIIDRSIGGPDAGFSMEQKDFTGMVKSIRNVEKAIGNEVYYENDPAKIKGREYNRSLYVAEDMKAGDLITEKNVRSVRPGYGLHPKYLHNIIGKKVNRDLCMGTRLRLDFIEL